MFVESIRVHRRFSTCCARSISRRVESSGKTSRSGRQILWGGVLSTTGDLVFFGDDSDAFAALDARGENRSGISTPKKHGKPPPMTYAEPIAAASNIVVFGLPY